MPPERSQESRDIEGQEARILLAVQAIKRKEISSIRAAATKFTVPRSTLATRLRGVQSRANCRPNSHKLTEIEEESLEKWIISMTDRGSAPPPGMVREMANIILERRGTTPIITVGSNWVTNFLRRHPNLPKHSYSTMNQVAEPNLASPLNRAMNQLEEAILASPLVTTIDQLSAACQLLIQTTACLEKTVSDLRAEREKQRQMRTRSNSPIPHEDDVSVQETHKLQSGPTETQTVPIAPVREPISGPSQPRRKALPKCGACGNRGHKKNYCPDRPY
jgi:hypothetical protein